MTSPMTTASSRSYPEPGPVGTHTYTPCTHTHAHTHTDKCAHLLQHVLHPHASCPVVRPPTWRLPRDNRAVAGRRDAHASRIAYECGVLRKAAGEAASGRLRAVLPPRGCINTAPVRLSLMLRAPLIAPPHRPSPHSSRKFPLVRTPRPNPRLPTPTHRRYVGRSRRLPCGCPPGRPRTGSCTNTFG